jgi:hypothetical protein
LLEDIPKRNGLSDYFSEFEVCFYELQKMAAGIRKDPRIIVWPSG